MTEIPYQSLESDTLRKLLEEIVTRDGTDYGEREISTEDKVEQVLRTLKSGRAKLVFDEGSESCNIVAADNL